MMICVNGMSGVIARLTVINVNGMSDVSAPLAVKDILFGCTKNNAVT